VAHVRKLDGGKYQARYRGPDGREHARNFTRKTDADRFLTSTEAAKLRGDFIDPTLARTPVREWRAQHERTTSVRPSTRATIGDYWRLYVGPWFDDLPIGAVDHVAVLSWLADLNARGLSAATRSKALQTLNKVMGAAVDAGLIPRNPCARVPHPKVERREMRFLSPDDVARLADTIDPRYRAWVVFGAYAGTRPGEAAALRRSRVDLLRGRVEIAETLVDVGGRLHFGPPKTRAGHRTVSLPRAVVRELEEHLGKWSGSELVFTAPEGGPLRPGLFRRRFWHPATATAGLEGLRPHDLRHTAVALWIAAGASPREIAARAGHTSVVTVLDRYGHLLPELDDRLRDRLDEMYVVAERGGTVVSLPV
jgi:integrase